jgi:hypothetical protein
MQQEYTFFGLISSQIPTKQRNRFNKPLSNRSVNKIKRMAAR